MSQQHEQLPPSPFSAALELGDGAVIHARVTSFEGDTIELAFSLTEAPQVAIAQLVVLRLQLTPSSPEVRVPVCAVERTDDETQRRYRLQPRRKHELSRLKRGYQRAHIRVRPRTEAPIKIDFRDPAGELLASGSALDISVAGAGVLLESSDELALTAHDLVELAIHLPDGQPPRIVHGLIRSRRLVSASIFIGIKFELERTEAFRDAVQSFARYARQRLDEMEKGERRVALSDLSNEAAA
jgi:hypothetical protein